MNYDFIAFIDSLGILQGLLLGTILISAHARKNKAVRYLGAFIIVFSLEPINNVLEELQILNQYPKLSLLPVSFHFLAYPLFYIYIQRISILEYKKASYWTLYPGILETVLGIALFFLPTATKLAIKNSNAGVIYFSIGLLYTFFILFLTLKWLHQHRREVENQFSYLVKRQLKWSQFFIYASIVFHLMLLAHHLFNNHNLYLIVSIVNIILIYWISYQGFQQQAIASLYDATHLGLPLDKMTPKGNGSLVKTAHKKNSDLLSIDEDQDTLNIVQEYIINSKCFTRDDLTIIDVAEAVNIHPKRISRCINSLLGVNFNNYINSYRIEYAKELFKSEASKNLTIEGIGIESGFRSKTTFYSAFNKIEGTTPANYIGRLKN